MRLTPRAHAAALAAATAAAAFALAPGPAAAASLPAGSTALLTGAPSLFEALPAPVGGADITTRSVSETGRYVAFASSSDGLVSGDDDRVDNVYRKDMQTGDVVLVSRRDGANGEPSHGSCFEPAISDDGQRVAFSCEDPLDGADENPFVDVYVRTIPAGATTLVSRNGASGPAGDRNSGHPSLSQDGTYVAFSSEATQLTGAKLSATTRVYRRHLPTQTTVLASRRAGATGAEGHGAQPSITDDGTAIAFMSADALDPGTDTNNQYDVYVRDVAAETTVLASRARNSAGGAVGNGYSGAPMISGNGLAVVFESYSTNLDGRDTVPDRNVYRRSLGLSTTALIDVTPSGARSGSAGTPSIDDSSHVIAFVSDATALDPGDIDPSPDVYVRYLGGGNEVSVVTRANGATGTVANRRALVPAMSGDAYHVAASLALGGITPDADPRRPSVVLRGLATDATRSVARPAGAEPFVNAGGDAEGVALTPDGRLAAFTSSAAGLGLPPASQNGVFVRDRVTGDVTLVSRMDGPGGTPFPSARAAAISADGRRVAFAATEYPGGIRQVWVRDLESGRTFLASRATGANGVPGDARSGDPSLDADGTRVVFRSRAKNLGNGDADEINDVHVRDLESGETILASRADGPNGAKGDGTSEGPDIDASGTRVSFASNAKNLGDGDTDVLRDVHLRDLAAGTTRLVSATPAGAKSDADVNGTPSMDASGTRVAFSTAAKNLGDASEGSKVFVRGLGDGTLAIAGAGSAPVLSPDGGHVAFDGSGRVLLRDLARGETQPIAGNLLEALVAPPPAFVADVSAQGTCVAFLTTEALVGDPRDSDEAYLRAVVPDCGDPAPVAGAGGAGGAGGDGGTGGGPVQPGGADAGGRDAVAPVLSRVRLDRRRFRAARGTLLRFRVSEAGTATVVVDRLRRAARGRLRARRVGALTRRVAAGAARVRLARRVGRRTLRPGLYRLTLTARDAAGNRSRPVRLRFRVL